MTTGTQVTHLIANDVTRAGEVLGRAFFDDPMTEYMFPDESARERPNRWLMEKGAVYGLRYGEVYTTSGVDGAAVWLPPGDTDMPMLRMIRAGMAMAPIRIGIRAFRRFIAITDFVEELHHRDMAAKHWYLMLLGVDPDRQGQGIGGVLIEPVVSRADASGLPCYLETMKEINVTFYKKHGFDVVWEGDIPSTGLYLWTMRREPAGSRA